MIAMDSVQANILLVGNFIIKNEKWGERIVFGKIIIWIKDLALYS